MMLLIIFFAIILITSVAGNFANDGNFFVNMLKAFLSIIVFFLILAAALAYFIFV